MAQKFYQERCFGVLEENEQDIHKDITWKLCPNLSWENGKLKKYSI